MGVEAQYVERHDHDQQHLPPPMNCTWMHEALFHWMQPAAMTSYGNLKRGDLAPDRLPSPFTRLRLTHSTWLLSCQATVPTAWRDLLGSTSAPLMQRRTQPCEFSCARLATGGWARQSRLLRVVVVGPHGGVLWPLKFMAFAGKVPSACVRFMPTA